MAVRICDTFDALLQDILKKDFYPNLSGRHPVPAPAT
jgi:hypothetical protein